MNKKKWIALAGGIVGLVLVTLCAVPYRMGIPGVWYYPGVDWDTIDGWFGGREVIWPLFVIQWMAVVAATLTVMSRLTNDDG